MSSVLGTTTKLHLQGDAMNVDADRIREIVSRPIDPKHVEEARQLRKFLVSRKHVWTCVCQECEDALAAFLAQRERWIPVTPETMPPPNPQNPNNSIEIIQYWPKAAGKRAVIGRIWFKETNFWPKYWMPIPAPPDAEGKENR